MMIDERDVELFEETLEESCVYQGHIFDIYQRKVRLPDGSESFRDIVDNNSAVAILALDSDENAIVVEQWRAPFDDVVFEIPAGKIDEADATAADAAVRELREECGIVKSPDDMIPLTCTKTSPGFTTENIFLFVAEGCDFGGIPEPDDGEFLERHVVPLDDLVDAIESGEISDSKSVTAILMYECFYRE